jgi:D-glycero-D-manno-heptose 1,7-bisphosphate phosphatase
MIEFHGRPFLEYLVEMLVEQGFERVLLLLGYLPEKVTDHFGAGRKFGLRIEYSITDVDNDTGLRMRLAREQMDDEFLLMYCDNYWPLRIGEMYASWTESGAAAQLTYYRNRDGYTRSNLRTDDAGRVVVYDKTRKAEGLAGVDIGFVLMKRGVLDLLPDGNCSFEATVYPQLVASGQLQGYATDHRYYSVGSHERLPLTEEFLQRKKAVFIDRDGVLNERMPRAEYVTSWERWKWLPGALEGLRMLKEAGYLSLMITNQPGVVRGAMTAVELDAIHSAMSAEAAAAGGRIDRIYECRHNWDDGCECRKPRPGMLFAAQRDYHLDLSRMVFFGDDERDGQAARAAGCRWIEVTGERPFLEAVKTYLAEATVR